MEGLREVQTLREPSPSRFPATGMDQAVSPLLFRGGQGDLALQWWLRTSRTQSLQNLGQVGAGILGEQGEGGVRKGNTQGVEELLPETEKLPTKQK